MVKDKVFYGWIMVASSLAITSILFGVQQSFGIFFKSLESEFELSRALTSSVFSAFMLLSAVFGIIGGWALDRYGPRLVFFIMGLLTGLGLVVTGQATSLWQLFLSYSLLIAAGTGATMTVAVATISAWFKKKRGLALGIVTSGSGMGAIFLAPLTAYLIASTDWRTAYLVLGLISWAVVLALSFTLRKNPGEIGSLPDGEQPGTVDAQSSYREKSTGERSFTLAEAFKTRSLKLLLVMFLAHSFCMNLVMTHVVPYAIDRGIADIKAATIISIIGVFNIVGRLATGRISDSIGNRMPGIINSLLFGIAISWLIWSHSLWMFYLFAAFFGLAWGGFSVILIRLVADIFGGRSLGLIMGIANMNFMLGGAIGPALAGYVFDTTGSYTLAFIMGIALMAVAAVSVTMVTATPKKL